jgi:hypothetical protein
LNKMEEETIVTPEVETVTEEVVAPEETVA